jgi:hypothetical protein
MVLAPWLRLRHRRDIDHTAVVDVAKIHAFRLMHHETTRRPHHTKRNPPILRVRKNAGAGAGIAGK